MALDPTLCPLCSMANDCALAAGAADCWCFTTKISRSALARLPPEAEAVVCICRRCASGRLQPAEASRTLDSLLRGRK